MCRRHLRGEVVCGWIRLGESAGISRRIRHNHRARLRPFPERFRGVLIRVVLVLHTLHSPVEIRRIVDHLCARHGNLGSARRDDRRAKLLELLQEPNRGLPQVVRDVLHFIQDDDAVCEPMNLTEAAVGRVHQGLQRLHKGRYNHGTVPPAGRPAVLARRRLL